jgi:hypothetical protein
MRTDTPLSAAGPADLAAGVYENLFALFRAMAVLDGYECVETERLRWHHAFPSNPMFKGAWGGRLAEGEVDEAIEEVLAWYRAREAPYIFWWLPWPVAPANLTERLAAHGFAEDMAGRAGMAADLHALTDAVPTPPGVTIERALDRPALEAWRDAFSGSFGLPDWAGQAWVDATLAVGAERAPWELYLGRLDGRAVATNMLVYGAGVAGA